MMSVGIFPALMIRSRPLLPVPSAKLLVLLPLVLLVNIVSFLFLVLHAITWFNLAPQAMVVHVGRKRLPGFLIAASNYVALVVVSAIVFGLILIRW